MRTLIVLALPCYFGFRLIAPGGPSDEELVARAQERFRLGVEKLGQPAESRRLFGQAADDFESLWESGRSPAYYLTMGNAEALAGRWPKAIWAYHCGLMVDPNNAPLREHLEYARSLVNYPPGNRGRPAPDYWPRWLHRPTTVDLLILATTAYSLAWLASVWWFVRRRTVPLVAALGLFAVAIASGAGCLQEEQRAVADAVSVGVEPTLTASVTARQYHVVIAADTPLHRGNGPSYPLHPDVPTLPAGLEAWSLHQRGAWRHVQLTTGEIGWIPADALLIVAR
jgi:hypothetical protein